MKKISFWAKQHPWHSRFLITGCYLLLTLASLSIGSLLKDLDITLSGVFVPVAILLYFSGLFLYPFQMNRSRWAKGSFYRFQKSCDVMLLAATLLILVCFGNSRQGFLSNSVIYGASQSQSPADSGRQYQSISQFSASLRDQNGKPLKFKERKALLRKQVKAIKRSDASKGEKIALIVLCSILALAALYGVAALACHLSCSGAEGAALIVGIGGAGLVIFLLILAIRGIVRKGKAPKQKET